MTSQSISKQEWAQYALIFWNLDAFLIRHVSIKYKENTVENKYKLVNM